MDRYEDWSAVTAYALEVTLTDMGITMSNDQRTELLAHGSRSQLFDDVPEALARLTSAGFEMVVFSNGTPKALASIVDETEIADYFVRLLSVDSVQMFKPAPVAYQYLAKQLGLRHDQVWLVSANPFDCAGAKSSGLHVAKIERTPSFSYPFVDPPDLVVNNLIQLAEWLTS